MNCECICRDGLGERPFFGRDVCHDGNVMAIRSVPFQGAVVAERLLK